jgi:large subunit ribosomal protein L4
MESVLKALQLKGKKVLFLVPKYDGNVLKSGRNIPRLKILEAAKASTYEIADSAVLVLQKSSVDIVEKTFAN